MRSAGALLALAIAAGASAGAAGDADAAHIILEKAIVESSAVQGMNMTVALTAYNTGAGAAAQVSISDTTWSPDAFEFVEGQPAATVDSIASGASFTHTFVLKPKLVGALETAAATVSYTPYPDGEVQSGVSTIISGLVVISPLELRVNQAVEFGKYASLGYCQTVRDWLTVFVAVVAITSLFFVNAAVSAGRAASQRRKREAALKELQG